MMKEKDRTDPLSLTLSRREREKLHVVLMNISLFVGSMLIGLVLLEILLIFTLPHFTQYYVREPNLVRTFFPDPKQYPGIDGDAVFRISSQGLRADELTGEETVRILAIGGSTTEGVYLDQDEAWPALLQKALQEALPEERVWVGNAGKSGERTFQHVLHVRHLLEQFPQTDLIVVLTGVNDFLRRLEKDDEYQPFLGFVESTRENLETAFSIVPRFDDSRLPLHKRTRIWFLLTKLRFLFFSWKDIQGAEGIGIQELRAQRHAVTHYIQELPDLTSALAEYRSLLNQVIDEAEKQKIEVVFFTQPAIWGKGLSAEEDARLLFGWKGPKHDALGFYSVEALAKGLDMYNETVLNVCTERHIACFDLAKSFPKGKTVFYDDIHFHEEGSWKVAELIKKYLMQLFPLPVGYPSLEGGDEGEGD